MSTDLIMTKLLMLPGIIMALSFHEFAHAWVSDKLGDPTPRRQGRVTLNPLAHIDWIGFLTLVLVGFGWGKPVQIDPSYYKNRRRDEFFVAIAGVTMNLILAVIQMGLSAVLVSGACGLLPTVSEVLLKAVVDAVLFTASFFIQRTFVFKAA